MSTKGGSGCHRVSLATPPPLGSPSPCSLSMPPGRSVPESSHDAPVPAAAHASLRARSSLGEPHLVHLNVETALHTLRVKGIPH